MVVNYKVVLRGLASSVISIYNRCRRVLYCFSVIQKEVSKKNQRKLRVIFIEKRYPLQQLYCFCIYKKTLIPPFDIYFVLILMASLAFILFVVTLLLET